MIVFTPSSQEITAPAFKKTKKQGPHTFRSILNAFSHPGIILDIGNGLDCPDGFYSATASACLTLTDFDQRMWVDDSLGSEVRGWLQFYCGMTISDKPQISDFALLNAGENMLRPDHFFPGTYERPDSSTTIIVQTEGLKNNKGWTLSGPDIETGTRLDVKGIPEDFFMNHQLMRNIFPLGDDIILTHKNLAVAILRTTRMEPA